MIYNSPLGYIRRILQHLMQKKITTAAQIVPKRSKSYSTVIMSLVHYNLNLTLPFYKFSYACDVLLTILKCYIHERIRR